MQRPEKERLDDATLLALEADTGKVGAKKVPETFFSKPFLCITISL